MLSCVAARREPPKKESPKEKSKRDRPKGDMDERVERMMSGK